MALLDGPFENRPSRYATDAEWKAATAAANAVDVQPIMRWDVADEIHPGEMRQA